MRLGNRSKNQPNDKWEEREIKQSVFSEAFTSIMEYDDMASLPGLISKVMFDWLNSNYKTFLYNYYDASFDDSAKGNQDTIDCGYLYAIFLKTIINYVPLEKVVCGHFLFTNSPN